MMMKSKFAVTVFASAGAAFTAAPLYAENGSAPDLVTSSLKMLGALVIVLVLILLVAWAAKRYLRFLPNTGAKGDSIRTIAVKPLGAKRSVHLLEVENRRFLIGSSENNITLLKEWMNDDRSG
jgi:flagellar biosynthetic protein FliO